MMKPRAYLRSSGHPFRRSILVAAVACSLSVLCAYADVVSDTVVLGSTAVKRVYPNGLTLIVQSGGGTDLVSINLLTRMGPLYEAPKLRGISSLMSRCLLYGGTANQSSYQINVELESTGAAWGEFTTSDFGDVWLRVTASGLDKALDVLFDIILNPVFDSKDLRTGKSEKIQAIKTRADQPFNAVVSAFSESLYGDHPYGGLDEGTVETIESLTRDDLFAWHRHIFVPNNMVFVVTGNVPSDEIARKFDAAFGKLKKGTLPREIGRSRPRLRGDSVTVRPSDIQGAYLTLGFPAPSVTDRDMPVMALIDELLTTRLFAELRDKRGLAYVVTSSYEPRVGPSNIMALMGTDPPKYQEARAGIIREFKRLQEEPVAPAELDAAKAVFRGSSIMSMETGLDRGRTMGVYELEKRNYAYADTLLKASADVRPKDIQRVAKKYFDHYVLAVIARQGSIKE